VKNVVRFAAAAAVALFLETIAFGQQYTQTNLISNKPGAAEAIDPKLVNPWGLTRTSASFWWVADNATGVSTLYNGPGEKQSLVVTIPPADPKKTPVGSPTAVISNGSKTDFLIAPEIPAIFIFATVDGTIAAWNPKVALVDGVQPSTHAVTVVKTTDGSAYTGLTAAFVDGKRYLYAANFTKGRIDVYDGGFRRVNLSKAPFANSGADNSPFTDQQLPQGFVPFNVQVIGNDIVVTYALHQEGQPVETDGPGLGRVDIYSSTGTLLRRLEQGDWLNAPWGVALAPLDFGRFSHDLLVGQFAGAGTTQSSGFIAAYDLATGRFDGLLLDASGKPIAINGIWSLSPANVSPSSADPDEAPAAEVYFTAGPNGGTGGLFGYLNAVSTDLIEGSVQ
jgi:uncharacterized protein (TIGR03118 family)